MVATPRHAKNITKKIAAVLRKTVHVSNETMEDLQESLNEAYKMIRTKWRATRKPTREKRHKKLTVLPVGSIFADAIQHNFHHESINDLFVFGDE